ncbi:MAG: M6 family metalloprotease domain-containing protein [Gemmatimonadetes bacterium]|nr:M6 family metalloprotease domain-containing protein [Gemmatimonadota bacterium]
MTDGRARQGEGRPAGAGRRGGLRSLLGAGLALLAALPVAGQYPRARPGQFEVRGFDIAPDGAWRRVTARIAATRAALLRDGALARLNAGDASMQVSGGYFVPVIPMTFPGVAQPFPSADYQQVLFSATPVGQAWSLKTFYGAQSRGHITLDGSVFDWVTLDSAAAYYEDGCNGIGVNGPCPARVRSRMADLLLGALDAVSLRGDSATVWNAYDNDGPDGLPNSGDDDGIVDFVTFLQARVDGACGGSGLWAHRFRISGWNSGQAYTTRTPRRGAGGAIIPGSFLRVNSYTLQSAVGGNTACTAGQIMPIGTVAHETGHAFGLPDLYDTDAASNTEGIGEWGLMGSGNYARPWSPASFEAWSLAELGWVTIDTLASAAERSAAAVQSGDTVYYGATADPSTYLLLENRQRVGSDTAMMNPAFSRMKGPGLLIWQIDAARVANSRSGNTVNTGVAQGVALVQADGLNQLRSPITGIRNRGDAGDPFPGTTANHEFGLATSPQAARADGTPLQVRIDRITTEAGGRVSFRYVRRAPTVIASRAAQARVRVNAVASQTYREVFPPGEVVTITADSIQASLDGRSALRWLSWSNAGPRTQVLVTRAGPPDSLFADFAAAHRVRVAVNGPGVVTSSLTGVVGTGAFFDVGVALRLDAVPGPGVEFLGWRGDSITPAASMNVTLQHPYDLTADFVQVVAVDPTAAVAAILGGPALAADQRLYLDVIGNRNGGYDVGDLLAWLRRTGRPLPTALRRALGAGVR